MRREPVEQKPAVPPPAAPESARVAAGQVQTAPDLSVLLTHAEACELRLDQQDAAEARLAAAVLDVLAEQVATEAARDGFCEAVLHAQQADQYRGTHVEAALAQALSPLGSELGRQPEVAA